MELDLTDNPATKGASAILQRKYGPLPFWAWLLILGGTAYGVRYYLNKQAQSAAATDTTASDQASSGGIETFTSIDPTSGAAALNTAANVAGTYGGTNIAGTTTTVTSAYGSNQAWIVGATSVLAGLGNYSAYAIGNALTKYVNGTSLATDPQAAAIVSAAIAAVGFPPEGVPVQSTTAPQSTGGQLVATLQTPVPTKVGDRLTVNISWKDSTGAGVSGVITRQLFQGTQWVDNWKVTVRNGDAVDSGTIKTKAVYAYRWITPQGLSSNEVKITIK